MSFQERTGWKAVGARERSAQPPARSGHSLVSSNESSCYLFGGFDGSSCFNDTWRLNLEDDRTCGSWREIAIDATRGSPPMPRASHAACWCEGLGMFITGGSGEKFGFTSLDDAFLFDFKEERWLDLSRQGHLEALGGVLTEVDKLRYTVPYGPSYSNFQLHTKPPPGYGRAAVFDANAGLVWVFGGTDGTYYTNELWCMNLAFGIWARLANGTSGQRPFPRYLSKAVHLGDSDALLFVGGGVPPFCLASAPLDVHHFDLKTLTWSQIKSPLPDLPDQVPRARFAHTVSQLDGDTLFVFGGSARDVDPLTAATIGAQFGGNIRSYRDSIMYSDAWLFRIKANQWQRMQEDGEVPGCLDFVASASVRGGQDVVVFGGFNKTVRSNRALRLRLFNVVPSLEGLCVKRLQDLRVNSPRLLPCVQDLDGFLPDNLKGAIFSADVG